MSETPSTPLPFTDFRYILVGNIIDKHYFGEEKIIRSGTKIFRAGAKVFLLLKYGGNGHENIPVYGLPRNRRKKINITINRRYIKNVRILKTYDPYLIKQVDESYFYDRISDDLTVLQSFADWLSENEFELKDEQNSEHNLDME